MVRIEQRPSSPALAEPVLNGPSARLHRGRRRHLGVVALLVVLLSSAGLLWRFGPWRNRDRDLSAYTVQASRGSLSGVITASGELQAIRRVNVSPRKQGLLKQLLVDEGEEVTEGQVLAVMDRGDFQDRLDEQKALLRQAEAEYRAKKDDYNRRRNLYKQGVVSADNYNTFRNEMISKNEKVIASQERVQQLLQEGRQLEIRAPFSGKITARFAEPGAFVTPTTTASTNAGATSSSVVELSQGLEVVARVPESDIGRIRLGQNADLRVDAYPDERFKAKVDEIAPRAEKQDNVTTFEVKLKLLNAPPRLLIGMTADIDFQTGRSQPKTLVPTVAIVTENGQPGVLLVGEKQQPTFQAVDLGSSSGDQTAILNGLEPGSPVFIDLPPWSNKQRN